MRSTLAAALLAALCTAIPGAAFGWQHPLYLAGDGYWGSRIQIDIQNTGGSDVAGAPVAVTIGSGAGEADFAGAAAESVRLVHASGNELLFAVYGAAGSLVTSGPVPAGGQLIVPAECAAGSSTTCYLYYDNPSAWPVPDFLEASLSVRNGSVEEGTGDTPTGWAHDFPDAQHEASWSTESPHSGSRCLKLVVAGGADPSWISTRQHGIYINGGADYTMRAWVRAAGVDGIAGWYIHVGNEADPMLINHVFDAGGGTYGWTEISYTFTAPAEADRASLGTVLWGTGEAWFDDVTLECTSPPEVSATAAAPESLSLTETGAGAPWYDDDPLDDIEWDVRCPVKLINTSGAAATGLATADLSPALTRIDEIKEDSIRVTDGAAVAPHYLIGDAVLFEGSVPAYTAQTSYCHLSYDDRIPPAAGSDYAGLLDAGPNLTANPSFELGSPMPSDWLAGPPPGVTVEADATGLFGARCGKIHVPDAAEKSWVGWRQDVTVQPGHTYLYSAWVRCANLHDGTVGIYAHYRKASGELCQTKQYADAGPAVSGTTDWTLMSGVFEMPEDCVTFQLHLTMFAKGTVWHDGVVLAEVAPAVVGELEPLADTTLAGPVVWPVNAVVKVFQDDPPPEAPGAARITAARNEREPLQLAIRSPDPVAGLTVAVDQPTHSEGAQLTDIEVAVVGYVPIDHVSGYYPSDLPDWRRKYPTDSGGSDGWPGLWPDPLLPVSSFDLPANTTQPVWITVAVPDGAPAGDYAGAVRFLDGAATAAEIPFTVRVWDFSLPDEASLPAIYDVRFDTNWEDPGKPFEQRRSEVQDMMAANRLCGDTIYPDPIITYDNGQVTADFAAFDAAAEHYFDDLRLPRAYTPWYFYLFGWGHPPGGKWGEAPYEGDYPYESADPSQLRPEFKAAYQACLEAYWDHMKAKGWADKVVLYISDEPWYGNPRIIAQMKALCDMIHEVDPGIPIYSSTWQHVPEWDGYIDVWGIGHSGHVSTAKMAELRAAGDRLYFTTDGQMCTDTPYLAVERLLPRYCFKHDVEAYEFWGVSWHTYNPYEQGWHSYIRQSGEPGSTGWVRYPNGDGFLVYPGAPVAHNGPVSSIRLEQAREGVEDYEYLRTLGNLIAAAQAIGRNTDLAQAALDAALDIVSIPNAGGRYSTEILLDPDAIFVTREQVASEVEQLYPFAGGVSPPVLLEAHPNEGAQGPGGSPKLGAEPWQPSGLGPANWYTWKVYQFEGGADLWIQACAQCFSSDQNTVGEGDKLRMSIDGLVLDDVWGVMTGAPGSFQWEGDVDCGNRLTLEFRVTGLAPGKHRLKFSADETPILWWVKVCDLDPPD